MAAAADEGISKTFGTDMVRAEIKKQLDQDIQDKLQRQDDEIEGLDNACRGMVGLLMAIKTGKGGKKLPKKARRAIEEWQRWLIRKDNPWLDEDECAML